MPAKRKPDRKQRQEDPSAMAERVRRWWRAMAGAKAGAKTGTRGMRGKDAGRGKG